MSLTTVPTWPEVITAKNESRHELVLTGALISSRIEEEKEIDPSLFHLVGLNYLNISETCLSAVPCQLAQLKNLTNLVLHSNKLTELPNVIGDLEKLKMLDLSRNCLQSIPVEISKLSQLSIFNLSANKIKCVPCMQQNIKLSVLDLSLNELEQFPDICYSELCHLAELKLQGNKIDAIPHSISVLVALKLFDCSDNSLTQVPVELAEISKLKDVVLRGNKLSDKRLMKLVDQCKPKQVLDYVRQHGVRAAGTSVGKKGAGGKKGKGKHAAEPDPETDPVTLLTHKINVMHVTDNTPTVIIEDESVRLVRPFIVCCIIRGVTFTAQSFRAFIQLQTRLHDTICNKRQLATIATHDLARLPPGPLRYMARPPARLKLVPLGQEQEVSATQLVQQLQLAAQDSSGHSGIHRYLSLLDGKQVYPCLRSSKGLVLSLPPITNSDITKISESTQDMLLEVTAPGTQAQCKNVMHELLLETLELGIGDSTPGSELHSLTVQQMKIVTPEGNLKLVYPSRVDLQVEEARNITILRE